MKTIRLGDLGAIDISNVDKKAKAEETSVTLCNFVDVYHNWIIDDSNTCSLMQATARQTQIERFSLRHGQVAITKDSETRDDIGIPTFIDKVPDKTVLGYHCALITPIDNMLDGAYLNCILQTDYAKKYFECNASGSGQRYTLTVEVIADFPVPLPPLDEQIKRAEIFTAIHRALSNSQSICSDLEATAKLLYDYWFVQFDFPDENGKPYKSSGGKMVWNDKLKREIPEGWSVATVGSISTCLDSKRVPLSAAQRQIMPGNIPYYGATGIMDYVSKSLFNGEYVLLAEDGSVMDSDGHPILQRVSGECWINNHTHVLEPTNGYSCKLLMLTLRDIPVVLIKTGSIQMKINQANLCNYKIVEAPLSLRKKLNEKLDLLDQSILRLTEESRQLVALRNFLLPLLMNGQVTIGDDGK